MEHGKYRFRTYNTPASPKQGGNIINRRRYLQKFTNYINLS